MFFSHVNKKVYRIAVLFLIFSLLFSLSSSSFAVNTQELTPEYDMYYYALHNQDDALSAFAKLQSFLDELNGTYPREYAGCYINSQNNLVICLVDASDSVKNKYAELCGEKIEFEIVKYSMLDFLSIYRSLEQFDDGKRMIRIGYNDEDNKLFVFYNGEIIKSTNEIIEYLVKKCELPAMNMHNHFPVSCDIKRANLVDCIRFVNCSFGFQKEELKNGIPCQLKNDLTDISSFTNLMPGTKIHNSNSSGTGYFTAGIWVNYTINGLSGQGLITCAHPFFDSNHVFDSSMSTVYVGTGTSELGVATQSNTYFNDPQLKYDCALLTITNQQYQPTTTLATGGTLSSLYASSSLPLNTTVYIGGYHGLKYGYVVAKDVSDGGTLNIGYAILTQNGYILAGDSGGPAWIIEGGVRKLVGIQSSGIYEGGNYKWAILSKASYAFGVYNASIYSGY